MSRATTDTAYRTVLADLLRICDPLATMKPGDTVRLKSGGPVMTIRKIDGEYAFCDWFDGTTPHHKSFILAQLMLVASPSDSD